MNADWDRWQSDIVAVIRRECRDLFPLIQIDEIDWSAWQPLYEQGCTAAIAVEQAISGSYVRRTQFSNGAQQHAEYR